MPKEEYQKIRSRSSINIVNKNREIKAKDRGNPSRIQRNVTFITNPFTVYRVPHPPLSVPTYECPPQNRHNYHYQRDPTLPPAPQPPRYDHMEPENSAESNKTSLILYYMMNTYGSACTSYCHHFFEKCT